MSLEEKNKALVRRFYEEFFNKGNLAVVDELHTADFRHYDSGAPDPGGGPEGYKRRNAIFLKAFPDRHVTIDDMVAEGDKVATRSTMRATQTGDLPGIPATGRRVVVTATIISRIQDGKIAEEWEDWNALGMLEQLGVVRAPW
jgi:steroid delta-isomerase-like uncharacterized protein